MEQEAPPERARKLLTTAFVLTGLRVKRDVARQVFRGVQAMRDSDTYMAILDEGREEEAKKAILLVGEERFGPPPEEVTTRLHAITDLGRLERMIRRAAKASSWQEVLGTE